MIEFRNNRTNSSTKIVTAVCGLLPTLLGGIVLLGWYLKNETLIQVSPSFVPMQYNTALGFVAGGIGLLSAHTGYRTGIRIFGGLSAATGLLTLVEYIFGVDLMIDQLFMEHYITVATSHPGRMAPNTALCFSLTGIALLLSNGYGKGDWGLPMIAVFGSLVLGLGIVAFSGYAMRLETAYGWGHLTRMAMHTSAGFIVLGMGLFWHAWNRNQASVSSLPRWFPLSVGIVTLTVTLSLWQALDRDELASHLILTFGVLLSGILSYTVKLAQGLRGRAQDLEQEVRDRVRAETGLENAHADLERAIDERTQELKESQERFALTVRGSGDGIWEFQPLTGEIWFSSRFKEMLGYADDDLLDSLETSKNLIHPEEKDAVNQAFVQHLKVDAPYDIEFRARCADGNYLWCRVRAKSLRGPDGRAYRTSGSITDISEQKQVEEKLRESEQQFVMILESAPVGVTVTNSKSKRLIVNQRYADLAGVPREELVGGATMNVWAHQEDREEYARVFARDGRVVDMEFEMQRHDGSTAWVMSNANSLNFSGEPVRVNWVVDLTDRKEAEEALRLAHNEAQAATKAKASFLATMSHEIRTPMNGVIGMIDLLQQTPLTEDQGDMVDTVRGSAYALLTIINDILDFSKIEAGKLDLESIPISICDAVEGVAETLSTTARSKNIWLRAFVDPNIPDAVLGDQVRLRQILFNLGGNAVKFTETGGVMIRADLMEDSTESLSKIRFQVIDTGIGLSDEGKENLFKAFTQAESSTTRRFGGTGLGLTICQRLVKVMGGDIVVESELGKGSTFSVILTLPIARVHRIASDGHELDGLRVLLDVNNKLTPIYLSHWGAEVTVVKELKDVLAAVRTAAKEGQPYDVVFMGARAPIRARHEVIKEIQSQADIAATRFVLGASTRNREERTDLDNTLYIETSPMKRASVIRTFAIAAGRASPEVIYTDADALDTVTEPPSIEDAEATGQLILLAEDNITNQKVILRQLHNLGYAADISNDGKEALAALEKKNYAVLLTDCHMPNLDGFGLTEAVRKGETGTDHRLPIVAITASALKAEVDHCYEVGMDDFLSKPVEMPKLRAALRKWMPDATPATAEPAPTAPRDESLNKADDGDVIDLSVLSAIFGDDPETVKEIFAEFVEPTNDIIKEIETAYAERSAKDVGAAGHKLKSSARAVGANALADLCAGLEIAGKSEDWQKIEKLIPDLAPISKAVIDYIKAL
jgi:PAS domain S-box-containing protein